MGETLWILGAFWIIYGIAGLRGHQNIKTNSRTDHGLWSIKRHADAAGLCWAYRAWSGESSAV